jgi:NAD(P)H-dependent FMN reductase
MTRLLLISGSVRAGSRNLTVLRTAAELAPGARIYEGILGLPHFHPDADAEGVEVPAPVAELRAQLSASDAVLICTPEYAGALPSILKNLLEWTIGAGSLYGKPVAWINASGPAAPSGGADAHASLEKVLAYAGAEIVPEACVRIVDPAERDGIARAVAALAAAAG